MPQTLRTPHDMILVTEDFELIDGLPTYRNKVMRDMRYRVSVEGDFFLEYDSHFQDYNEGGIVILIYGQLSEVPNIKLLVQFY